MGLGCAHFPFTPRGSTVSGRQRNSQALFFGFFALWDARATHSRLVLKPSTEAHRIGSPTRGRGFISAPAHRIHAHSAWAASDGGRESGRPFDSCSPCDQEQRPTERIRRPQHGTQLGWRNRRRKRAAATNEQSDEKDNAGASRIGPLSPSTPGQKQRVPQRPTRHHCPADPRGSRSNPQLEMAAAERPVLEVTGIGYPAGLSTSL